MPEIPDIQNPDVSRTAIVLGFAYSLTPEGAPGTYNKRLASQLAPIISNAAQQAPENRPWIGMQWEIFDALEAELNDQTVDLIDIVPLSHVGAPPHFTTDDIANVDALTRQLELCYVDANNPPPRNPSTQAGRVLAQMVAKLLEDVGYESTQSSSIFAAAMFDSLKVAQYLNRLVDSGTFHQKFYDAYGQPFLEIHDLYRTNVGSVGVESRILPAPDVDLGRFQRIRVNRFIIESIFPNAATLKRGKYLSTRGVLDQVTKVVEHEGGQRFDHAFVYGHPEHSPRCRRQLIETSWAAGWNLQPNHVYDMNDGEEWDWDTATAQIWTRSKTNWDDYERMGKARLD